MEELARLRRSLDSNAKHEAAPRQAQSAEFASRLPVTVYWTWSPIVNRNGRRAWLCKETNEAPSLPRECEDLFVSHQI